MSAPSQSTPSIESILEATRTVYSLPLFYERLNEAINHPRTSIADISKIITEDQGLTARILKLGNSPMFGYHSSVDSITKAVTIIGTQQLRDLALAASVMGVFKGIPEDLMSMSQFWKHSISCGIIARGLAIYFRENNAERFFVAGMLHDIGQLVMCVSIPDYVSKILLQSRADKELYSHTEQKVLGFDHTDLGSALLHLWKIPGNIGEPVSFHHSPSRAELYPKEAAIVHLSDIICQSLEFGSSGEWCVPPLDPKAWERLIIPVSMISSILKQTEPQIEETFSILSEGL